MSVAEKMTAIADAIREKTGDTGKLSLDGMAEALRKLPGPIVATASGSPISLTDATDLKLRGLKLFGKTTQNGTPTPEAPMPLVSAAEGGDIRTLIFPAVKSLVNDTLCGLPVTSGGTYTDETGQQWVCDEVDFARGVYVQRVGKVVFDGTEYWIDGSTASGKTRFYCNGEPLGVKRSAGNNGFFSHGVCGYTGSGTVESIAQIAGVSPHIFLLDYQTVDTFKAFLAEQYADGTPLTVTYILATPIETPLSAEELVAYAEKYGVNTVAYGKSTQNGTPTPDAPVPIVNSTDVVQVLLASTPNGLPGLPVTSGGTYTDETGQQWVCDEVDFARGVYVQRVRKEVFDGSSDEDWIISATGASGKSRFRAQPSMDYDFSKEYGLCDQLNKVSSTWNLQEGFTPVVSSGKNYLFIYAESFALTYATEWKEHLAEKPMTCLFILATPIETPLSAEELAAYAALHTNYPNTTILNDGGAGMEVSYVADTKLYIDNKINAMAAAIVNA